MTAAVTWDYLGLIATALGNIRTANGYFTDAGLLVTREPEQRTDTDPAGIAVIQTAYGRPENRAMLASGVRSIGIHVIGQVPKGFDTAQQTLHEIQQDIDRCLGNHDLLRQVFPQGSGQGRAFPQLDDAVMAGQVEGLAWVGIAVRYTAQIRIK